MGSGKGKGRQKGSFGSKALRAAFVTEWQSRADEVPLRKRKCPRSSSSALKPTITTNMSHEGGASSQQHARPKLQLSRLRSILQERQLQDRLDHPATLLRQFTIQVPTTTTRPFAFRNHRTSPSLTPPGWILYYNDDDYNELSTTPCSSTGDSQVIPSLACLCTRALAPALPDYLQALGPESLQYILSLLPPRTITALSVLVSQNARFPIQLARAMTHHPYVTRLALSAPRSTDQHGNNNYDDDDDEHSLSTDKDLLSLLPLSSSTCLFSTRHVPDSWEDNDMDTASCCTDELPNVPFQGILRLERLELSHWNSPFLSSDAFLTFIPKCHGLSHLGLSGSLSYDSGPDVLLQLPHIAPMLQVLDVSYCVWITEGLLRSFWNLYTHIDMDNRGGGGGRRHCATKLPLVRAVGCLCPTESVRLEMEYSDVLLVT